MDKIRRYRLTQKELELWVPYLIARDGKYCQDCGVSIENLDCKIEVDHIDNDRYNNPQDGSNYQLLCKHCNVAKENKNSWLHRKSRTQKETDDFIKSFAHKIG